MRNVALVCTLFTALFCASAASAADFTWAGGDGNWSQAARWSGGVAPSGTVGTLSFPAATCNPDCPAMGDDVPGLTASTLLVRAPHRALWQMSGDAAAPLTLTGGLDLMGSQARVLLGFPIVLGADNHWSIEGVGAGMTGVTGNHSLAVSLANAATLGLTGPMQVGPVTITGDGRGQVALSAGASLNSAGGPVDVANIYAVTSDPGSGSTMAVGALTMSKSGLIVESGKLSAPSVTLDAQSSLQIAAKSDGTTAGTDYAQLTSTGPIDLGGSALTLSNTLGGSSASLCSRPAGTELTLVSTTGTLSGAFGNAPEGGVVQVTCGFSSAPYRIRYHRTGPTQTVTATAVPNYSFFGSTADKRWSVAANWSGGRLPSAGESFAYLGLRDGACAPPTGCTNDLVGLSMFGITSSFTAGQPPHDSVIKGNAITLGAGGLTFLPYEQTRLELPIMLGADQTWTAPPFGGSTPGTGIVAGGVTGPFALTLATNQAGAAPPSGAIVLEADNEIASAAVDGTPTGTSQVPPGYTPQPFSLTLRSGAKLNATNGHPVTVTHAKLAAQDGSVGALHTEAAIVQAGVGTGSLGALAANSAVFDPATTVSFAMSATSAADTPGAYGRLTSAGAVDLGGAALAFGGFNRTAAHPGETLGACTPAPRTVGTVYTLVSAAGALTGTFANAPEGAVLTECPDAATHNTYEIHYTAHTVTATVKSAAPQTGPGPDPDPDPQPGSEQAQVSSGVAAVHLPTTSNGRAAAFAIPADAFPAGTRLTVSLRAAASALIAAKPKPVGSQTVTTKAGKPTSVTVKLSPAARKRLQKKHRLKVTVTVTAKAPSGATATRSKTITLKKR